MMQFVYIYIYTLCLVQILNTRDSSIAKRHDTLCRCAWCMLHGAFVGAGGFGVANGDYCQIAYFGNAAKGADGNTSLPGAKRTVSSQK